MHFHFTFHHIQYLIHTYGYEVLVVSLIVEYFGIPFPGETMLTTAGFEWGRGSFTFLPLLLVSVLSSFAGSLIAYFIGRYLGRPVILKYGRWVRITPEKLEKSEEMFEKYTGRVLIISRFIAVVRILVPYIAGFNGITLPKFMIYSGIGSLLWCATFLLGGRFLGHEWKVIRTEWDDYIVPAILIVIIIGTAYYFFKRRKQRLSEK